MTDKPIQDAIEFVDQVEKFSGSKLKRKAGLLRIYEEAQKNNNKNLFEDVTFTSKYIQGLLRIVTNNANNPEITNIEKIKKDFSANIEKVISQLKEIIADAEPEFKKYFEENYFELSQQGFNNLNELLYDLDWAKQYINAKKRE